MSNYIARPKDEAERARAARGWKSFHEWGKANRTQLKEFNGRPAQSKADRERLKELIRLLEVDYETLIRPNL